MDRFLDFPNPNFEKVFYLSFLRDTINPDQNTPANNWRCVLRGLGWEFDDSIELKRFKFDGIQASLDAEIVNAKLDNDSTVPFIVMSDTLPPVDNFDLQKRIMKLIQKDYPHFFFTARRAYFHESNNNPVIIHTPIFYVSDQKISMQSIYCLSSATSVMENAIADIDFLDHEFASSSCFISIAINTLDEDGLLKNIDLSSRFAVVSEKFNMPFLNVESLSGLGFVTSQ